jgi:hypothetical protein
MMMAVSPLRAAWLLSCLRLRRLANLAMTTRFSKKRKDGVRAATPGKRAAGGVFAVVLVAFMLFGAINLSRQAVLHMQCIVSPGSQCALAGPRDYRAQDRAAFELHTQGVSEQLARAVALQLSLLLMVSFLTPLGSRELANTDGDLEWLVTLPATRKTLLVARVAERSVANPMGWFALMPPCLMLAWYAGFRWCAPLIGFAAALALLPIAAVLRTIVDTGLRLRLSPAKLRNLQAMCGLAGLPFMYLAISFGMPAGDTLIRAIGRTLPDWLMWTPPGLAARAITASTLGGGAMAAVLLLAQVALCVVIGVWVLGHQLRNGVVASGSRETGRRRAPARGAAAGKGFWQSLLPRSPVQRRELRLLARDRNFLVQSLLMPLVIVGSQFVLNGQLSSIGRMASNPVGLALAAWGISAYMLMLSALQTLNNEGQSLWMLYTFPTTIEEVLKDKAKMWAVLALAYPSLILGFGLAAAPSFNWHTLSSFAIVLAGLPVFSAIAVALGVFACDPLAQDVRTKVKPTYIYLYILLANMYAYAIYADKWFQTVVVMVLTAGFAQALWQKARDTLPYLLDPAAAPPPRVSSADGMMAAMLFFVLQVLCMWLFLHGHVDPGLAMLLAFLAAGAIVYALVRLVYWRSKTTGVPTLLSGPPLRALAWGLGGGMAVACVGLAYLHFLQTTPWLAEMAPVGTRSRIQAGWMLVLAVLLAPLCEEFIFRGLVFGGLRRSTGLLPAMLLSAGLFAIVHPPVSMLPVFALGLCTAYVYERSKGLLAPMLVHAVYNAVVVGWQLW